MLASAETGVRYAICDMVVAWAPLIDAMIKILAILWIISLALSNLCRGLGTTLWSVSGRNRGVCNDDHSPQSRVKHAMHAELIIRGFRGALTAFPRGIRLAETISSEGGL